jgi:hypothetical protein
MQIFAIARACACKRVLHLHALVYLKCVYVPCNTHLTHIIPNSFCSGYFADGLGQRFIEQGPIGHGLLVLVYLCVCAVCMSDIPRPPFRLPEGPLGSFTPLPSLTPSPPCVRSFSCALSLSQFTIAHTRTHSPRYWGIGGGEGGGKPASVSWPDRSAAWPHWREGGREGERGREGGREGGSEGGREGEKKLEGVGGLGWGRGERSKNEGANKRLSVRERVIDDRRG